MFNWIRSLFGFGESEPEEIIDWTKIKCIKCMDKKEVVWPLSDGSLMAVPCSCTKVRNDENLSN